ncbi:MAG: right-handed parallel beta-helix repeat-containing protein [Spirochaetales bacterium]|nr:right-handed parallel beta-helix repeat-containing protein [Spirochaetales bacterium]
MSDQFLIVLESDSGSVGAQSISDFTIDGTNRSLYGGLWIEGRSDVKIQNMEFKNIDIMGAVIIDDRLKIIPDAGEWATGIQVLDCRFENTSADLQTYSTGGLNIGGLDGAIIRNIEIIEDEGYGIKFYKDGYLKNTVIEDCTITVPESDTLWGEDIAIELWNLYEGNRISRVTANTWISLVNQDFFSPDPDAVNILLEDSHIESIGNSSQKEGVELAAKGAVIRNNYISGKGFGIALWAAVKENVLIEGNIIRHMNSPSSAWNGGAGIFIANSKAYDFSNITIMHNVIDETATGIWFKQETIASTMDGLNVFNNYFGNIASNAVRVTGAIVDLTLKNNFLDDGAGASTLLSIDAGANIVTEVETGNLEGTPDFTSVGDFWDSYYKPESDSLLIDAGFDTGLRTFSGAGPDIGAFEIQ